ncbi:MAG: hypothetical protein ACK5DE_02400 [Bacteroidota bacterium]|jgi:hypothetical protein
MKAIQLLVNSQLPPDLRDYNREFDSKSLGSLMADVARKYPDQYERISKAISDIGRKASYFQGESLTLADNRPVIDRDKMLVEMDNEIEEAKKTSIDKDDFDNKKIEIWSKYNDKIQKETAREALARKNNLAYSVMSGARGKPAQLKMMLSTPGLYTDAQDNIIPLFVRTSFAEGLRPAEYLAGTYGARKAVLCLHEDTLVRLPNGDSVPIKHIEAGMHVVGADKHGNTFPVKVTCVYSQGLQPVNRYTFRRGCGGGKHEVICTSGHKFLQNDYRSYNQAYNKFIKGKGPKPQASLVHEKDIYPIGEKRSRQAAVLAGAMRTTGRKEPYAMMLGILTGDGCLTDSDLRIRLSCADESMINDLSSYMCGLGLKLSDRRTSDNFDWEIVADNYNAKNNKSMQKGVQGFVANARMAHKQILIDEGLAFHRAENKKLPTSIHTWDNDSIAAYISGLIATDGSIYFDANTDYPRVSFAMAAKDVIFGLHKLLQHRFGVYGTEISFRDAGGFGDNSALRKNRLWEFSVTTDTGIKRLLSVLPPIPGCKEAKRQKALLAKLKQENPYPKARLEFVKDEGYAYCYDIEVDHPDHLFVLDSGLVTSNSTKRATAKGGDLAKQMVQSAASLVVSENDCGAANGIDLESDDKSLRGRVLARDTGKVPAGTILDKNALANIRKQGVEKLIVRSPMTCQAKEGVCARCMGLNALGKFPAKGDAVGITAAQAIGEPITQGALNVKHQGGAAGTDRRYAGFSVINQFVQTPDTFPDKAVLSKIDGQVNSVIEAPQGGYYVTVDNEPHYVAPGYPVTVKVGERVEAGDMMSEGLADPGEVVELRGLGEGRKYYADKLKQLLDDSGMEADRRNTELMARAALDHLQITDVKEDDEYLPDDVVSYSYFSNKYTPPKDTNKYKSDKAVGTYLQSPALHYTIGTKITPKIAKHLKSAGFEEVFASPDSPTFKPHMVRLRAATHHGTDWLASMHTSYLKKQLSESAIRGEESNVESNIHFAPRLAIGTNFGENIEQTGKF